MSRLSKGRWIILLTRVTKSRQRKKSTEAWIKKKNVRGGENSGIRTSEVVRTRQGGQKKVAGKRGRERLRAIRLSSRHLYGNVKQRYGTIENRVKESPSIIIGKRCSKRARWQASSSPPRIKSYNRKAGASTTKTRKAKGGEHGRHLHNYTKRPSFLNANYPAQLRIPWQDHQEKGLIRGGGRSKTEGAGGTS